jgi:hypothetical protein
MNFFKYRIYFICIISDVILSNAIAYQVERHVSLQMRTCRLDLTKFTLQMHMHSNK